MSKKTLTVAIIAGEASGDILGAGLLEALKQHFTVHAEGVGGPLMVEQGLRALYPMERLSVMGFVGVLKRLPELLLARRRLIKRWLSVDTRPDIFIGIDAPDFNLGAEIVLRKSGLPVVHYVSPTVWAWRPKRIHKIKKAVDLMLALFPFEAQYYKEHDIQVAYVGHPLANEIPLQVDKIKARAELGLGQEPVLAVLPGSRTGEAKCLAPLFFETLRYCREQLPECRFLIPVYNEKIKKILLEVAQAYQGLNIQYIDGKSQTAMIAADAILLASGTATLEAMLIKRPMVVAYKLSTVNYHLVKNLFSISKFSLPNLLIGKPLVPEFIQDNAVPVDMADAVLSSLSDDHSHMLQQFTEMHHLLRRDASKNAALAIKEMITVKGHLT